MARSACVLFSSVGCVVPTAVNIQPIAKTSFDEAGLVALLTDVVDAGASVGFLAPLAAETARAFWHGVRSELDGGRVLLGAYAEGRLVGAVQLAPSSRPNAAHRAEVQKLLVLQAFRRRGVGKALMSAIEAKARELGRWLLVLDNVPGHAAEKLYERIGYVRADVIPHYALRSGGGVDPTAIFYKQLGP